MNDVVEDILCHYGVKRRSGRYPWGSGDDPYQHSGDLASRFDELKKSGLSETEIAKAMEFPSTTELRAAVKQAKHEQKQLLVERAKALRDDGVSISQIGREMGVNESTVRSWFNENREVNQRRAEKAADTIREELKTKRAIDVGSGVERELGISTGKLDEALRILESEGYVVEGIGVPQATDKSKRTTVRVIHDKDILTRDLYQDYSMIQSLQDYYSPDGGEHWDKRKYPESIDSSRVKIKYGDEGPKGNTGSDKDGVIEIRPGVKDLDLGNSHYAQVRILVDGTHYLKGMAMYSNDIPDGYDIVFNTNKKSGTPMIDGDKGVLKPIKDDPDNPFGAYIKRNGQSLYPDPKGKYTDPVTGEKCSLSAINKLKEEGDWDKSSRNLSQQFLSKQPMQLVNQQLNATFADYKSDYDDIMSIPNPTVRKKMLQEFAGECDSATIHLKAAALPRQETRVILPVTQLKDNEIYAPYLKNGETVCLVRYPHGGTFEIPELTVNNRNSKVKSILGNAVDAVGINSKVAERLSGADFDGDTVIVIPTNSRVRIKTSKPLEGLKDFDPKSAYPYHEGMKVMTKAQTQSEMGKVSNLITDMTLRGAPESDIEKAVRHSMVVIDAHKHKLDWKQSEIDNDIATLKKRWQPKYDSEGNVVGSGGASTLLSRRKQSVSVPERRGSARVDPETGHIIYKESGRTYANDKGETILATQRVPLISTVDDMTTLSTGTKPENAYAKYGNQMKELANQARKKAANTKPMKYSPTANKTYKKEVNELLSALEVAEKNAPKERRAQAIANSVIKAKIQANPELSEPANKKDLAKVRSLAIDDARAVVGASGRGTRIHVSENQWKAIQAGAISDSRLRSILKYMDDEEVKKLAMPRAITTLSTAKQNKIKHMQNMGYTIAEIAENMGYSTSTISNYLTSS